MTRERIIELLQKVKYPGYDRDIVSFGMVQDVQTDGKHVIIQLVIRTEDVEKRQKIIQEVQTIISAEDPTVTLDIQADEGKAEKKVKLSDPWEQQKKIEGVKRTIAVASGKGGVGKSTVAANLAGALVKKGYKVGLLDLDIFGPSVPIIFGIEGEQPPVQNGKVIPIERFGLKLISFGMFYTERKPVVWRGPMVAKMVKQFFDDVQWGNLDFLIFDLPPGTGDVPLTLMQTIKLDGAVVVTTPQDLALIDVQKGTEMFRHLDVPVFGIVENMSYFICPHCGEKTEIFPGGGGKLESHRLNVPLLGNIPIEPQITSLSDKGIPIIFSKKDSTSAEHFLKIADALITQLD